MARARLLGRRYLTARTVLGLVAASPLCAAAACGDRSELLAAGGSEMLAHPSSMLDGSDTAEATGGSIADASVAAWVDAADLSDVRSFDALLDGDPNQVEARSDDMGLDASADVTPPSTAVLDAGSPPPCPGAVPVCVEYYSYLSSCFNRDETALACQPSLIPDGSPDQMLQIVMLCEVNLQRIMQACR